MKQSTLCILTLVLASLLGSAGCGASCEALEARICKDLGEDCEIWKSQMGGIEPYASGRRAGKACANMMGAPYSNLIGGIKSGISAIKQNK